MNSQGNTILITGGGSGIGLAFAERFLREGNEVIICGRRAEKLQEAKSELPALHTRVCDVSSEQDRRDLVEWVTTEFPSVNVLVNNAGIQQRVNLTRPLEDWGYYHQELAANLEAPIHLTMLLLPHLMKQSNAAVVNVSSGLGITPAAWVPIYSATKAALHSFTLTLRLQLAEKDVRVIEVLPPAVNTDLGGPGLHTFGAPLNDFADAVFEGFRAGELEIGYGGTEQRAAAMREQINQAMTQMWENFRNHNPKF